MNNQIKDKLMWFFYDRILTPYHIIRIRRKKIINVFFMLSDISLWKTELLYIMMLKHPRFNPVLGIVHTLVDSEEAYNKIKNYCDEKNYSYTEICDNKSLYEQTGCDLILYSQPYQKHYYKKHRFLHNLNALVIHVSYFVHSILEDWTLNSAVYLHCWQYYFENQSVANEFGKQMLNKGKNIVVTGYPMFDEFINFKSTDDPWKYIDGKKRKRIIYAPHHTIGSTIICDANGINYSTFLEYGEFMLEMAEKYKDEIQFVFKPHPYLWRKLVSIWGEEKTNAYYKKWEQIDNGQVETGRYISLFMTSDAMIHDCASFTYEYHYTQNPVLYLVKDDNHEKNISNFMKVAYDLHYKGHKKEDIESFLIDIIHDKDPLKAKRQEFYKQNMLPPNGKNACENITDSILGVK